MHPYILSHLCSYLLAITGLSKLIGVLVILTFSQPLSSMARSASTLSSLRTNPQQATTAQPLPRQTARTFSTFLAIHRHRRVERSPSNNPPNGFVVPSRALSASAANSYPFPIFPMVKARTRAVLYTFARLSLSRTWLSGRRNLGVLLMKTHCSRSLRKSQLR